MILQRGQVLLEQDIGHPQKAQEISAQPAGKNTLAVDYPFSSSYQVQVCLCADSVPSSLPHFEAAFSVGTETECEEGGRLTYVVCTNALQLSKLVRLDCIVRMIFVQPGVGL